MNSNKNLIIGAIVLVAVVLIGWIALRDSDKDSGLGTVSPTPSASVSSAAKPSVSVTPKATPKAVVHTVRLTSQGPTPKTVTIRKGDAVTFTNETGSAWWIKSNCSGFDAGRGLALNESYTLTFGTAMTCTYNNYLDSGNATYQGTIIIQ